jgi:hypothetical protein
VVAELAGDPHATSAAAVGVDRGQPEGGVMEAVAAVLDRGDDPIGAGPQSQLDGWATVPLRVRHDL